MEIKETQKRGKIVLYSFMISETDIWFYFGSAGLLMRAGSNTRRLVRLEKRVKLYEKLLQQAQPQLNIAMQLAIQRALAGVRFTPCRYRNRLDTETDHCL